MDTDQILLAVAVVIIATVVAGGIARRLSLGPIVALLAVGAAFGPHSPYPLLADYVDEMEAVGEVGVVLLLFLVGLDIQPERLRSMRGLVFGSAVVQFVLTTAAIAAVFLLLQMEPWQAALLVALGLAMSSDAVAVGTVEERGESATPQGRAVLAVVVSQGFIAIPVLAAIPLLDGGPDTTLGLPTPGKLLTVLGAVAVVYLAGRFILPIALTWSARRLGFNGFGLIILAAVFAAAWILDMVGVSMALGSLMIGMILSTSDLADQVRASVAPRKGILLGVFFIAIGMSIDPHQVAQVGWELIAVLPLLLLIKVAIVAMLARLFGMPLPNALLAGLVLAPFDEIGFVIFASAHDSGLLNADAYALGLTLISFSFITSSLMINFGYRLVHQVFGRAAPSSVEAISDALEEHVVIVGYSYAGRVICSMLERVGIRYVAFDLDLDRVAEGRALGHDVRYGDVNDPNMLGAAAIAKARAAVVTTHEYEQTKRVTGNLRHFYPQVPVLTAVPYLFQRDELRRLGAPQTVALMPEGMLDFGALVLGRLQVEPAEIERLTDELRADDYALLRGVGGVIRPEMPEVQAT
jgi:glutathione-regulated potassium-efflux system ancillary protein KefC